LGWAIIAGLVMLTMARLGPELPTRATKRYQNVPPPEAKPLEYIRENPLAPVPDSVTFKQEVPNIKK
jgi:hypothetical protein